MKNKKAFTLVEISIALTIIGLLISGILVTKNIIFKAKIDNIIGEVKNIENIIEQFETKYQGLPGDFASISKLKQISPLPSAGNGNGVIDTSQEALQFWYHLKASDLLTANFNGTHGYRPASSATAGGIYASSYEDGGYSVLVYNTATNLYTNLINNTINSGRIILNLSYFTSGTSNYTSALLSPIDAKYLDQKLDDGNPSTGMFRAAQGTDVIAANQCINTDGTYNTSVTTASCYVQIIIGISSKIKDISSATCANGPFGSNSYATPCPIGYRGYYSNNCDDSGTLTTSEYMCEAIKCSGGKSYGETITVPCPSDSKGDMTFTCGIGGVYRFSYGNCLIMPGTTCTGTQTPVLANTCPIGYMGSWLPRCNTNILTSGTSCSPIVCPGSIAIGNPSSVQLITTCPTNYTNVTTNGARDSVCILPVSTTPPVLSTVGVFRVIRSNCVPNFEACPTIGNFRTLTCPASMSGKHVQICGSSGYWETYEDACVPVTCGGEPIGSFRIAQGKTCPGSYKGVLLEICDYTDTTYSAAAWQTSLVHCQANSL